MTNPSLHLRSACRVPICSSNPVTTPTPRSTYLYWNSPRCVQPKHVSRLPMPERIRIHSHARLPPATNALSHAGLVYLPAFESPSTSLSCALPFQPHTIAHYLCSINCGRTHKCPTTRRLRNPISSTTIPSILLGLARNSSWIPCSKISSLLTI